MKYHHSKHFWTGLMEYRENGRLIFMTETCAKCGAVRARRSKEKKWKIVEPILYRTANGDLRTSYDFKGTLGIPPTWQEEEE